MVTLGKRLTVEAKRQLPGLQLKDNIKGKTRKK